MFVVAGLCAAIAFAIENQRDRQLTDQIGQTQSELLSLGGQITSIKDAELTTPNDFIAAYAQVEPLERDYDQKLNEFDKLYNAILQRDAHRSLFDLQRYRGTHHPKTWEKMSEIIGLVRRINDLTKREISVAHAMASLPEAERARFWHEQFLPLAVEERALRHQLEVVGQGEVGNSSIQ